MCLLLADSRHNVAMDPGTTCTASSELSGYECEYTFDGNTGTGLNTWVTALGNNDGAWINVIMACHIHIKCKNNICQDLKIHECHRIFNNRNQHLNDYALH